MDDLVVGKTCAIIEQLEPLMGSFKSANIEWKKKYKKYLGQSAIVLSLFGDDSLLLKFENGKVFRFPRQCVERSELCQDELRSIYRRNSGSKKSFEVVLDDHVFFDEINISTSPEVVLKRKRRDDPSSKDQRWMDMKQSCCVNDDSSTTKEIGQMQVALEALNLHDYYRNLVEDGFESLEYLENANFGDLIAVGMKRGHARRLLNAMKEYRANPSYNFQTGRRKLVKRASFCSSLASTTSGSASSQSSNLSRSLIPEYEPYVPNDTQDLQSISDHGVSDSRRLSNITSLSGSQSDMICGDGGYLTIAFTKRPLGFGIMSPLCVGAMVSSILDTGLKEKRLCLGLPLLKINERYVNKYNVEEIAAILSFMNVPLTVTFGLNPYFEPGQRLTVITNSTWYPCTVKEMSNSKVTVRYDDYSLGQNNIEIISDYNRIRQYGKPEVEPPHSVFPYKHSKVPSLRWVSTLEVHGNASHENRGDEVQNGYGKPPCNFAEKQRFSRCKAAEQPLLEKRRRQDLSNSTTKMTKRIPNANLLECLNVSASNGYRSTMI